MKAIFYTILILTLCAFSFKALAQPELQIPYEATKVILDGQLKEWNNSSKTVVATGAAQNITVYAMHDGQNLYLAYTGIFEDAIGMPLFAELLIDPALKKTGKWSPGIWWFHVSKTDCESNGEYGVYNNCLEDHKDWHATPNWGPAPKVVEISIPFSKIGIDIAKTEKIGISFVLTNTMSTWKMWPPAADRFSPSTWATATLAKVSTH